MSWVRLQNFNKNMTAVNDVVAITLSRNPSIIEFTYFPNEAVQQNEH